MAKYQVKQVVQYVWKVEAANPVEAARIALDQGIAASEPTIPADKATDITVSTNQGWKTKIWRFNRVKLFWQVDAYSHLESREG